MRGETTSILLSVTKKDISDASVDRAKEPF